MDYHCLKCGELVHRGKPHHCPGKKKERFL